MNYGRRFVTLYRRQRSRPTPRKRNSKKQRNAKKLFVRLSEEALQIGKEEKRKEKDIRKGIPISMQSSKVKKKKE